ncbi:hypothetical protein BJY00DRAFT_291360 [Aspergillus carlsbadensis]|nr:hypothetical protein BJY00DRAFT_291360 [Aspergillus carlsbadensis]
MSADQLLYPMDFSDRQEDWLDFDSLLQLPAGYLDSQPTSVESISPRDLDQSFTDVDFQNWDADPAILSQAMFPEIGGFEAPMDLGQPQLDSYQHFVDPNDVLQPVPPQGQMMLEPAFDGTWVTDIPSMEAYPSFRHMVESQVALDTRGFSKKEKRRDASIALHLQRLQNAPLPEFAPLPSNSQLSSPDWSVSSLDAMQSEPSYTTPNTSPVSESLKSPSPSSGPEPGAASMQLVLDLNMNTTTNVPRKQKPRSRAQRENYIKARKYGVCEKHRKQHKRCNCLEKAAAASLTPTTPASTTLTVIPGSLTNHERVQFRSSNPGSGQTQTRSVNAGLPGGTAWPSSKPQGSGLSMLKGQQSVSPTGHDRAATPSARSPTASGLGLPNTPSLYRDREANKQQARLRSTEGQPRQDLSPSLRQSVNSPTETQSQTVSVRQGALNRHRDPRNTDSPTQTHTQTLRVCQGTLKTYRSLRNVDSSTETPTQPSRASQGTLSQYWNLRTLKNLRTVDSSAEAPTQTVRVSQGALKQPRSLRRVRSPTETNTATVCFSQSALDSRSQGDMSVSRQSLRVSRGSLNTSSQGQELASLETQTQQLCTTSRGAQNPQNAQNIVTRRQGQGQASIYCSQSSSSLDSLRVHRSVITVLSSLRQGSRTSYSWAGHFLRRLAVFSSGMIIASRKGMGFF